MTTATALGCPTAELDRPTAELDRPTAELASPTVALARVDSAIGPLLVAVSGGGLARVAFAAEDLDAVAAALGAGPGVSPAADPPLLEVAVAQIGEYLAGTRRHLDLPLDLTGVPPFRRAAMAAMAEIPYGATTTYAALAAAAGNPAAVRAAASACARNPVPLAVPCHRVLRSDGRPGGFLGGTEVKAALLDLEARHTG